ncbi:ABC transporter permease [Actinobacteria bacterium YIM 96077]|uniref:Transport permease protein n=1 Tax=Phytoactinopolyspora halophila TaxID=1981511 RepID=A0A329QN05_9ACTN|nr:ABC transporter permease [Phytoactinopolyspora halophila]AYY12337.1 ABC transporter permease [Actinobacteria bacterium YIM 96077]RAW13745.1 ABC transporter permease [Phytoactinopolyspora halophila]
MTATTKLVSIQTKRSVREPVGVFFMIAFAPLFAIAMGLIFGNDPQPEFDGRGYLDANLVSFAAIIIAIVSMIVIPVDIVTQRETGALRRFRATPLQPAAYIASDVVVRFVLSLLSVAAMLAVGTLIFGANLEGNIVNVLLAAALGILAFLAVGYALSAIMPTAGVAQLAGNVLVFPLIFLSGGPVPLAVLPDGVRDFAQYSPLTQLVELLQALWSGEAWHENWVPIVVLVALLGVATAVAARLFRWE